MRILLYAFEPFGKNTTNISKDVLLALPDKSNIKKVIFPTTFDRKIYSKLPQKNPEVVFGLGQYPSGRKIRIERKTINQFGSKKTGNYQMIFKDQPMYLYTTLKLRPTKHSRLSYNAGKYVCNFSMFLTLSTLRNSKTTYAFLHIPKNMNLQQAISTVLEIIKQI